MFPVPVGNTDGGEVGNTGEGRECSRLQGVILEGGEFSRFQWVILMGERVFPVTVGNTGGGRECSQLQ